jgi:hypothetical protein
MLTINLIQLALSNQRKFLIQVFVNSFKLPTQSKSKDCFNKTTATLISFKIKVSINLSSFNERNPRPLTSQLVSVSFNSDLLSQTLSFNKLSESPLLRIIYQSLLILIFGLFTTISFNIVLPLGFVLSFKKSETLRAVDVIITTSH